MFSLIALSSCADEEVKPNTTKKPPVKTGVKPVADSETAVIETDYGPIKIELYSNIAPKAVARFKELAKSGFYDGVAFHRVSPMVVQGGDPLTKDDDPRNDGTGKSDKPNVPAEFSDVPFERGTIGAARTNDFNGANSQFFITMQRNPAWDTNYTVFGRVVEGLNNADTIAAAPKNGERPTEPVRIKRITFVPRQ